MDPGGWKTFVHCVHTTWTFSWLQSVLPGGGAVHSSGELAGKSFSSSVHLAVASCLQTAVESYGTCENFDKLFLHNFQREDEKSF